MCVYMCVCACIYVCMYVYTSNIVVFFFSIKGIVGLPGKQGLPGPEGREGPPGFRGEKGKEGGKGDTGEPGLTVSTYIVIMIDQSTIQSPIVLPNSVVGIAVSAKYGPH